MSEGEKNPADLKDKRRRGYCSIDAIDPGDGKKWQVLLPDTKMDYVASQGHGAAMELADTVRWTLLHPCALFNCSEESAIWSEIFPKMLGYAMSGLHITLTIARRALGDRLGMVRSSWYS